MPVILAGRPLISSCFLKEDKRLRSKQTDMRFIKNWKTSLTLMLLISWSGSQAWGQALEKQLRGLFPKAEILAMKPSDHFQEVFEIILPQPLDHSNPDAGEFSQHLYLSHAGYDEAMILETDGYGSWQRTNELSRITKGNQLIVEYRFYGKSRPDPIQWEYLTNDQAVEDYHRIVTAMKEIYSGPWVSTGVSKGGETVIIYRSRYPDDVTAAVPYVAPINLAREDPRTEKHIKTIGTRECREKLYALQRRSLKERKKMLALLKEHATKKKMSFSVGYDVALEYAVLEFTFSFWQWNGDCSTIPAEDAPLEEVFAFIDKTVGFSFYSDKTIHRLLPSYYQHMRELGYYGFPTGHLDDLLEKVHDPDNAFFAPKNVDLTYNPDYMRPILEWVESKGERMIYIYGGLDTWGACAVEPYPSIDAIKMVLPDGNHSTRIKHFPKEDQELIYKKLGDWLEVKIHPLATEP